MRTEEEIRRRRLEVNDAIERKLSRETVMMGQKIMTQQRLKFGPFFEKIGFPVLAMLRTARQGVR